MLIIPCGVLGKNMEWKIWGWTEVEVTSDSYGYEIRKIYNETVLCRGTMSQEQRFNLNVYWELGNGLQGMSI